MPERAELPATTVVTPRGVEPYRPSEPVPSRLDRRPATVAKEDGEIAFSNRTPH